MKDELKTKKDEKKRKKVKACNTTTWALRPFAHVLLIFLCFSLGFCFWFGLVDAGEEPGRRGREKGGTLGKGFEHLSRASC